MNILLFGGAFDPAHVGHSKAVMQALKQIKDAPPDHTKIDQVWLIPDAFKFFSDRDLAPFSARVAMLNTTMHAAGIKNAKVKYYAFDRNLPKGAYYILNRITKEHPSYKFWYLIGTDQAEQLDKWIRYKDIQELPIKFVVVKRSRVSSTMIRSRAAQGIIPFGLATGVTEMIKDHELYGYKKGE